MAEKEDMSAWQLLSINEAARRLDLCRKSVEIRIARNEIRSVKIGRRRLIRERDLRMFVEKRLQ